VSVRHDLRDALAAAGGPNLSVAAEEPPTAPSLPALYIRPGSPYRSPSLIPACIETWRLEVVALVPIDAVAPLDALDALLELTWGVLDENPYGRVVGVIAPPAQLSIAGVSHRAAVLTVEITT
jgi:hypothetical protein